MASFENATRFTIEPGLGIARVGSSSEEFFIGPEVPGAVPNRGQPYKDAGGKLKRQAARFRVYAYDAQNALLGEVTAADAVIDWRVHLTNRKAAWYEFINAMDLGAEALPARRRNAGIKGTDRRTLIIDPGVRKISGPNQSDAAFRFDSGRFMGRVVALGELRTDAAGRLLVLGGSGRSQSVSGAPPTTFANNDGWFDDTSDGTVRATIRIGQRNVEAAPAMVAVTPPNFAPGLYGVVTLFDVVHDLFVRDFGAAALLKPSFYEHIYPVFQRLSSQEAVNHGLFILFGWASPSDFRDPAVIARLADSSPGAKPLRQAFFNWFRDPESKVKREEKLPPFYGDTFNEFKDDARVGLSVTRLQYKWLKQWAAGDFLVDQPLALPAMLEQLPVAEQPPALNRAALDDCLGGPFHPGIELTWTLRLRSVWEKPFRLRIAAENAEVRMDFGDELTPAQALAGDGPLQECAPGTLTWWLGIPWQTDEASCDAGYEGGTYLPLPSFWAARVPNHVLDERSWQRVNEGAIPSAQRFKHLAWRQRWLRFLREPYLQHIADMVAKWDQMGVIVARPGPANAAAAGLPNELWIETELDPSFHVSDPTWEQLLLAEAGKGRPPQPAGPAPGPLIPSARPVHGRGERA